MTENNNLLSKVKQILSTNLYGYATTSDLESCDSYLDKIRAFFVPSLEYKIYLLLEKFLYSTDSRWKEHIFRARILPDETAAGCNNGAIGGVVRSVVKHMVKNDLVYRFLDSIILRHRLNKICRELNTIALENDSIARNLNACGFVNDPTDHNWFTYPDIEADSANAAILDIKNPIRRVKSLIRNNVSRNGVIDQPTMSSEYRASAQALDTRQNPNCFATESLNDDVGEAHDVSRKNISCNIESETMRHSKSGLKIIIRKMCVEDCGCSTLSRPATFGLRLPCKPSDLIERIFDADPSLTESCLIVMKRKFRADIRNLCSCLNDVLDEKVNAEFANTLRLYCDIRPGYISFKLKVDKICSDKHLFVARVPICQNIPKCMMSSQNFVVPCCDSSPSTKADEPKCSERCKDDGDSSCDTLVSVNAESKMSNDTCCSDQDFAKSHIAANASQCETESSSEKMTVSTIVWNKNPECIQNLIVSCCNEHDENVIEREEITNVTRSMNLETSAEEYRKTSDSIEINCDNVAEKRKEKQLIDSSNSIVLLAANNTNCTSCESLTEKNNMHVSCNEEFDDSSQTGGDDKHNRMIRSPGKELHRMNQDFAAITSSIASFEQHSENDKQLVELNCFLDNYNGEAIGKQSDLQDGDSLSTVNVEIGQNSDISCSTDDFINIAVTDDISNSVYPFKREDATEGRTGNYFKTTTTKLPGNTLLTTCIQTSRLKVSSKGITVDISYPRTVVSLVSDDRKSISTVAKTCDGCKKVNPVVCTAKEIVPTVARKGSEAICDKIDLNISDRTRGCFIRSCNKRFPTLRERLESSASLNGGVSTEDFCAKNNSSYVTSGASRRFSCSTASEFAARSNKRGKNAYKLRKSSKFRQRGRSSSSSDILRVNSFVATKYRRTSCRCQNDDYRSDTQPQMIFVLTKFRNSVDRSLGRIKRLIYAKLDGVFFNSRMKTTNIWKTLWKTEESSKNMRKSNMRKCSRQGYSITSCSLSTPDYCKRGCVFSSESDVTLSILKHRSGERNEKEKLYGYQFSGQGSEVMASVRSIEASLWSHDLLTPTQENLEEWKLKERTVGKEKIKYRTNH